jgi:hypothetical protein
MPRQPPTGPRATAADAGATDGVGALPENVTPAKATDAGASKMTISDSRPRAGPAQVPTAVAAGPPARAGRASDARRAAPSAARVTLSLAVPSPVLGVEDETELRIVATGAFASPLPFPRILCSAGRVEDMVREGPTSFSARFLLPSSRFPTRRLWSPISRMIR